MNQFGADDLTGVAYYRFFTICIAITAVLFLFVVKFYKVDEGTQKESGA